MSQFDDPFVGPLIPSNAERKHYLLTRESVIHVGDKEVEAKIDEHFGGLPKCLHCGRILIGVTQLTEFDPEHYPDGWWEIYNAPRLGVIE